MMLYTYIHSVLWLPHFPPVDSVWALTVLWRIRGRIIGTVLCCIMSHICAKSFAYDDQISSSYRSSLSFFFYFFLWIFLWLLWVWLSVLVQSIAWKDLSQKQPVLFRVGCNTLLTRSFSTCLYTKPFHCLLTCLFMIHHWHWLSSVHVWRLCYSAEHTKH